MSPLVAGVDLGGTKILACAVRSDDAATPLAHVRLGTPRGATAVAAAVAEAVSRLEAEVGRVDAVGLGAAGLVDASGTLRTAPNLPGLLDVPLADLLGADLARPVVVDNDANCAAVAEHRLGAARGADDAVVVTLGTGIGSGVIIDGRLRRGAHSFAGEIGHVVVDPSGPPCPCGRQGCWERFASGSGLGRLARDHAAAGGADALVALAGGDAEAVRGEHVTRAAAAGDPEALEILSQFGWWVALGLANLTNLLDPEIVVLGGGLVAAGDALVAPVRAAYRELIYGYAHRPPLRIVAARFGPEAGAIGAAVLASEISGRGEPTRPGAGGAGE